MKGYSFVLSFLSLASGALALNLNAKRSAKGSSAGHRIFGSNESLAADDDDGTSAVGNVNDVRYTTNITINGVEVHVALDTGSTDLWQVNSTKLLVSPPNGVGTYNNTGVPLKLLYGDGTYGVSGSIGVAEFQFGDYRIQRQAFLNVEEISVKGLLEHGIYGLLGLSFHVASASPINSAIQSRYGADATWGHSVLQNIFDQHPTEPNFIALDLARTDDLEETDGGSFGIGEYEDEYAAIVNAPKLPQFPRGGDRWTTLLEGVSVNGDPITLQPTISGVPAGHSLALLDTGDPTAIVPVYLLDAIYSRVPGSAPYIARNNRKVWIVPCNATTSVSFRFGGQEFPIHPLDLTRVVEAIPKVHSACVSAFVGADGWGRNEYEISLGDSFLRNVYSLYDFGDPQAGGTIGEPYMQLLSQIEPEKAAAQVGVVRSKTMKAYSPEADPLALVKLLEETDAKAAGAAGTKSGTATGSPQAGIGGPSSPSSLDALGPAILALLAVNTVVGIILVTFAVLHWLRRGRAPTVARSQPSQSWQGRYMQLDSRDQDRKYHHNQGFGS
ncbi:acid protease [Coprinopsis marcescibilis]|uniref:Acid protease n=1 Tax=Coprinopsis marcescibilis TaxID=230819 RepID=A0A5C3KMB8_COPMA|nr:acid protease [Coprinopsis marcescibilis]